MSAAEENSSPEWRMPTAPLATIFLVAAVGCAGSTTPGAADVGQGTDVAGGASAEAPSAKADISAAAGADAEDESVRSAGGDADATSAAASLWDGREPDPKRALPEVTIRHLGMHLGGEPNTPEAKRPWLDDLERGTVGYLQCYRLVHHPMTGGTFGVDVYVSTEGGTPEIRGTRQRLGEANFEQCMTDALLALEFHRPPRPTMISYSMRFDVNDAP